MPEPILMSIATTLATKAATALVDVVKNKFSGDKKATAALESAQATPTDAPRVKALAERLEEAVQADPAFARALNAEWSHVELHDHKSATTVTNTVSGRVTGKVLQAGDIHGNVTF
ncbi:MAG TPA: hypothetical protein VM347_44525 [Nonomuraea sp.]|nr:hypothetical protein [Nonomuraea sp.]